MSCTRWLLLIFAVLLGVACTSAGRLAPEDPAPGPNEAVLVFGARPADLVAAWNYGVIENDRFIAESMPIAGPPVKALPQDGYLVLKVRAGTAIGAERWMFFGGAAYTGEVYAPCGEVTTMAVQVPPTQGVYYLGDVHHYKSGGALKRDFAFDFDAARRHVDARFPALRGLLQPLRIQWLKTAKNCNSQPGATYSIPITIPKAR